MGAFVCGCLVLVVSVLFFMPCLCWIFCFVYASLVLFSLLATGSSSLSLCKRPQRYRAVYWGSVFILIHVQCSPQDAYITTWCKNLPYFTIKINKTWADVGLDIGQKLRFAKKVPRKLHNILQMTNSHIIIRCFYFIFSCKVQKQGEGKKVKMVAAASIWYVWYVDVDEYGLLLLKFSEAHTAEHIKEAKTVLLESWGTKDKVTFLTPDHASIVQIFVVLQTAKISAIRDQCRRVVNFFWSNTKRHRETVQMGKPKMKLIQEIETWWNGTVCHASKIIRRTWNFFTSLNSTQCSWTMDS